MEKEAREIFLIFAELFPNGTKCTRPPAKAERKSYKLPKKTSLQVCWPFGLLFISALLGVSSVQAMTKYFELDWKIPVPQPLQDGAVFDRWTEVRHILMKLHKKT